MDNVNPSGQGLAEPFEIAGRTPPDGTSPGRMIDADEYLPLLGESDLTDVQARELVAVLDTIARGFVEYAWSGEVCGQLFDGFQAVLSSAVEPVDSDDPNQKEKGEPNHDG